MLDHFTSFQLALFWIAVGTGLVMPLVILVFLDLKNLSKAHCEAALAQYIFIAALLVLLPCSLAGWISTMEAVLGGLLAYAMSLARIQDRNRRRKISDLESRLAELQKMADKTS